MEYETGSQLIFYYHDGDDVQADIENARFEIMNEHPVGAFAVADIVVNATLIVTHYEVDIEIEYKRTEEELDSIVVISTEQFLRNQMLSRMSNYTEETIFRTHMQLTEESISELIKETYYENPHRIVMLPIVTVQVFPDEGADKIYVIQFGYTESTIMLLQFNEVLTHNIQQRVDLAEGNTEAEILLSIVSNLIESSDFDERAARSIHAHGAQNLAATALGALFRGNAVGEGFAMALKALADRFDISCSVVLGELDGMVHAWNIVSLYDEYYHIDVAMCVRNGIETAFLKTDAEFEEMMYTWDRNITVECEGELTLEDILGAGLDDDDDDNENQTGESNADEEE